MVGAALLFLGGLGPGCSRAEGASPPLELLTFKQSGAADVCLNELLAFNFSEELDRSSVTPQSVRISDPSGAAARGRLQVDGARLTFEPELPLAADLSDGGLRPGTRYTVELGGFPRPDGIRSGRSSSRIRRGCRTISAQLRS